MQNAHSSRRKLAFSASLLAHALVLGLLWKRQTPELPRASAPVPVAFELRTFPLHRKTAAPAPPAPAVTPAPHRRSHAASPASPVSNAADAPAAAPGTAAPLVPQTSVPAAAPDLARAGAAAALQIAESLAVPAPAPPLPGRGVRAPSQIADPAERIRRFGDEALGPGRVERGQFDPYFKQLGATLAEAWKPSPSTIPSSAGARLDRLFSSDLAQRFGKSGSPLPPGDRGPEAHTVDVPPGGLTHDALNLMQECAQIRELMQQNERSSRAVVRLTQSLKGKLLDVELLEPSPFPALDFELLSQLRSERLVLPVPPLQGLGIRDPIRSRWAFQVAQADRLPVLNSLDCKRFDLGLTGSFDLLSRGLQLDEPGRGPVIKRVVLLSVE